MTRWLLVLVLWAMLAGTAGAETTWVYPLGNGKTVDMSTPCHDIGATALTLDDKLIQCHGSKGWTRIQMICEQKMQAAMEAMEKEFYYKNDGRMIFPFKPDGEPIPGDVGPLIRQWAEAKACWRKP